MVEKVHYHVNEIEWRTFNDTKWGSLRWKDLLNLEQGNSKEFIFGLAELPVNGKLPLHAHQQAETGYIISGRARIRLGKRSVELGASSAMYFPGELPHSIETFGSESLCYIYTYACEKMGHNIQSNLADDIIASRYDVINNGKARWAIREEIEQWIPVEVSKGYGIRARRFFDRERGNCKEMIAGIGENDPGTHYTLHYHEQPEIYYIAAGIGVIYVKDNAIEVSPGSAVYVGKRVVHGIDSLGEKPMRVYWLYGTETVGQESSWTPMEDTYTEARWRR